MRKSSNCFSSLVFLGLISAVAANAQTADALPFVLVDRDPRTAAMGFGGLASTGGGAAAYSSFRNPAVVPLSSEKAASAFSYQDWAPEGAGSSNFNLGSSFKVGRGLGFSIGGAFQSGETYKVSDSNGNHRGTFSPYDLVVNGGLGARVTDFLSLGVNARYARERVSDNDTYQAFCADAFLMCSFGDLNLAAGLSSVGLPVKSAVGASFSLPSSAALALAYSRAFAGGHAVEAVLDGGLFFNGSCSAAVGAEYSWNGMVFVRVGRHQSSAKAAIPSSTTLGLGLKLAGISLDAAYVTGCEALGKTLTLGLGFSFQ